MMARWVAAHLGAGLVGALAVCALLFFSPAIMIDTVAAQIWFLVGLLILVSAPALIYQAWALRHGVPPQLWIYFTLLALLPAPALLYFGTIGLLNLISTPLPLSEEESSRWILTGHLGWILTGFAVGLLWAAPMQWFAVRGAVPFRRWWLYAGLSLGLAAATVVAGFLGLAVFEAVWPVLLLPLPALIYAIGTYPAIRPLHRTSGVT